MAKDNIIQLIIEAKDLATDVIRRTAAGFENLNSSTQKAAEHANGMSAGFGRIANVVKYAASALAAYTAALSLKDAAMAAARVETLGVVLEVVGRNAGYSKSEIEGYAKGVEKMGITTAESRQTVIKMAQAQLDLAKSSQLARVAQDAAVIGQVNSSEALNRLLHGITTLQPEILRTIGITVNLEAEYKKVAKATNRTVEELSYQEKQQIALNAVLREGQKISGAYTASMDTVGKMLGSLQRYVEQASVAVGKVFLPVMKTLAQETTEGLKSIIKYFTELEKSGALQQWANVLDKAVQGVIFVFKAMIEAIKFVASNFDTILVAAIAVVIIKLNMLAISFSTLPFAAAVMGVFHLATAFSGLSGAVAAAISALSTFAPVLAAIISYQIGKWFDSWIYKTADIDISGINRLNEAFKWTDENQQHLLKTTERQTEELKRLGFEGTDALKKFNEAKKAGLVIYDEAAQKWVNVRKNIDGSTQALEANEKEIGKSNKTMEALVKVLDKVGESTLKFAGEQLKTAFQHNASISSMKAALESYISVSQTVYNAKMAILTKARDAMRTYGATAQDVAAMNVRILELEKAKIAEQLSAWEAYYSKLKTLHELAISALKESARIEFDLKKQLMTASEAYYETNRKLEEEFQKALKLSGEDKIKALQAYQKEAAATANVVEEGGNIIISKEAAVGNALKMVQKAAEELKKEHVAGSKALKDAGDNVDGYKQQLEELDKQMTKEKTLTINTDEALAGVRQIKEAIDAIPDVTYKKVIMQIEGTGSTLKPITEKIAEVKGKLKTLSGSGQYLINFEGSESGNAKPITSQIMEIELAILKLRHELKKLEAQYNKLRGSHDTWSKELMAELEHQMKLILMQITILQQKKNEITDTTKEAVARLVSVASESSSTLQKVHEQVSDIIGGIGELTEKQINAKTFLASLTGDVITSLLLQKTKTMQELEEYYKQGLITAEEYKKGVNAIQQDILNELKEQLVEGKITQSEYDKAIYEMNIELNEKIRKAQEDAFEAEQKLFKDKLKNFKDIVIQMPMVLDETLKRVSHNVSNTLNEMYGNMKTTMEGIKRVVPEMFDSGGTFKSDINIQKDYNITNTFEMRTFDEQTTKRWLRDTVFPEWEYLMKLKGIQL